MSSNNVNTAFHFMKELSMLLPSMDKDVVQKISIKFLHAKNSEEFDRSISAILLKQSDLKDKIMQLSRHVLGQARDSEQKVISDAKRFIEQLIHSHEDIDNVDAKMSQLRELLSSEIEPVADLAWKSLETLAAHRAFAEYFSGSEILSELTSILNSCASRWMKVPTTHARGRLNTDTHLGRLLDLLCVVSTSGEKTWIGRAINTLTHLFQDLLTALHSSLSAPKLLDLITLMDSRNDLVSMVSLKLQSHIISESPLLIQILSKENTEHAFRKLLGRFEESDNKEYRSAILTYLHQIITQFPTTANYKNVYHLFFTDHLPALLDYIEINKSAILPFCHYLNSYCTKINRDARTENRPKLPALLQHQVDLYLEARAQNLQHQVDLYLEAKAQNDVPDEYIELQRKRVANISHSLTLLAPHLAEADATTLCTILTYMLADTCPRMVVFAACELANLCRLRKSMPIGCIRPLIDLLDAQNEKIIDAALLALYVMIQNLLYLQPMLRTSGFERVKSLLVSPSDQYMGNALLFWGECIQARRQIDDTDVSFIQNLLLPACDGKHRKPALKVLLDLLTMEQFPLPLACSQMKWLVLLLNDENVEIVRRALEALQALIERGLAAEISQAGVLELLKLISALIEREGIYPELTDLLNRNCATLGSLLLSGFKNEAFRPDLLCFTSTLLDKKSILLQRIGYNVLLECADKHPSSLSEVSHVSFVKVVKFIDIENENMVQPIQRPLALSTTLCPLPFTEKEGAVQDALTLSTILCALPFNFQEDILTPLLNHYHDWLQEGNKGTKHLVTKGIATICIAHPNMRALVYDKKVINEFRKFKPENSQHNTNVLSILTSLSYLPEARNEQNEVGQPEFVDYIVFGLRHENQSVRQTAVQFMANMCEHSNVLGNRELTSELWTLLIDTKVDESTYENGLMILSKLMPRNKIISALKEAKAPKLKSALILALNITSKNSYLPSFSPCKSQSIPSPFISLYQPHVKTTISDIAFKVGEAPPLHCHKVVLAAQSDYFKALFLSDFAKSNLSTLVINDVDPVHFEQFTKFLYEQVFHYTTPKAAIALHEIAGRYMVPALETQCELEIVNNLAQDNVAEIFDRVSTGQSTLQEQVMHWMMNHYAELPKALQEFIQQDDVWPAFYELLIS